MELGDPVGAAPFDPAASVGNSAVPVTDSVRPPLELLCDASVGDPGARALVLLGELDPDSEGGFGPPEGDAVVGEDGSEGAAFSASPVFGQSQIN